MSFTDPFFLFGVLSLAIPVIIHLIRWNKPEKLAFSTLNFFRQMADSTLKRLNLKRRILLFLRLLALTFLVLAWAKPVAERDAGIRGDASEQLLLLIDNSLSTAVRAERGPLLYQLQQEAKRLLARMHPEARVKVLNTHGLSGQDGWLRPQEAMSVVDKLQSSQQINVSLDRLDNLAKAFNEQAQQSRMVILSDGQFHGLQQLAEWSEEQDFWSYQLKILQHTRTRYPNSFVASMEVENSWISANQDLSILVQVEGVEEVVSQAERQNIRLYAGDRLIGQQALAASNRFRFRPTEAGQMPLRVELLGDEFPEDNSFYAVLDVPESLSVLYVHEVEDQRALAERVIYRSLASVQDVGFSLSYTPISVRRFQPASLDGVDVIVLDELVTWPAYMDVPLQDFIQKGGGLWFLPSPEASLERWNSFFSRFNLPQALGIKGEYGSYQPVTVLDQPQARHPVFGRMFAVDATENSDQALRIDLPQVYYHWVLEERPQDSKVLQDRAQLPLLIEYQLGEGTLWQSALSMESGWSDWSIKAVTAPLVYNGLQYLRAGQGRQFIRANDLDRYPLQAAFEAEEGVINVAIESQQQVAMQQQAFGRYQSTSAVWRPGFGRYQAQYLALNTSNNERRLAFYREEPDALMAGNAAVEAFNERGVLTVIQPESSDLRAGSSFALPDPWVWLVLAALLTLMAESLVARFMKVSTSKGASAP